MQTRLPLYPFPDGYFKSFRVTEKDTEVLALQKENEFLKRSNNAYKGIINKVKIKK